MTDKLELMLEAEKRGILPPDKAAILNEARRRGLVSGQPRPFVPTASIGPTSKSPEEISAMARQEVAQQAADINKEIPMIERESFREKATPILGGAAAMLVPGGGVVAPALMGGAGVVTGELVRQRNTREGIDLAKAGKEGAGATAGALAFGGALKGLGMVAKRLFHTPLSGPQRAAAEFARQEGVPFPLSSAAPQSGAARTQQATRALLPGDIKTQLDANKVAHFLNQRVGTLTEKAQVFDDAARQGQQFLREVFEPGEVAIKNAFARYTEAVGDDALIPTANTMAAAQRAAEFLERRGQTTGGLYQRLRTILKKQPGTYTPREFDELYGAIIKQAFTSRAGAGGEGRILLEGITRDLDEFGKIAGVSFADDIAKAGAIRERYRELRKIPQLERLATEMKDRGGARGTIDWMESLFSSGNGRALAKFRELNPELYHDLADAWLARQIDKAATSSRIGFGRVIDGGRLRTWFEQNQAKITEIFGKPQTKALDNFTLYAKHMTGAVNRATTGRTFEQLPMAGRMIAEGSGMITKPALMIPGEAASFVLARGLSDPGSALFKLFTDGFSPATRSFVIKSGQLAGQQAGRKALE